MEAPAKGRAEMIDVRVERRAQDQTFAIIVFDPHAHSAGNRDFAMKQLLICQARLMDNSTWADDGKLPSRAQPYRYFQSMRTARDSRLHGSAYKYASQMSLALACEDMAVNMLFTVIGV